MHILFSVLGKNHMPWNEIPRKTDKFTRFITRNLLYCSNKGHLLYVIGVIIVYENYIFRENDLNIFI